MCPAGSGDGTAEAGHGHGAVAGGEVVHEFAAELEERGAIDVVDDRHAGFLQDFEPFGFHAGRVGAACVRAGLCRGDEDGAVGFGQVLQHVDRHDDRACGVGMAGGGGVGLQVVELRGDDDADWIFLGVELPGAQGVSQFGEGEWFRVGAAQLGAVQHHSGDGDAEVEALQVRP